MKTLGSTILKYELFRDGQRRLADQYRQVQRSVRQQPLGQHDVHTALTIMGDYAGLGGRRVASPSCFLPSTSLLGENLMMPEGKCATAAHESHAAVLADSVVTMIENYRAHLSNCVIAFEERDRKERKIDTKRAVAETERSEMARMVYALSEPGVERAVQPLPFFFFLDNSRNWWSEVTPTRISSVLGDLWPYSIDECRRQATRNLREQGVPDYLIEMQQGRFLGSNPPFGMQRQQTVFEYRDLLLPALNDYMEDLGWNS